MKRTMYLVIWIISCMFIWVLLYHPHYVGVGDNSDFGRVMQPIGLRINIEDKYVYAQDKFDYHQSWDNLGEYLAYVTNPPIENKGNYHSTQFLVLKIAGYINGLYAYMTKGIINQFHMWSLAVIYILLMGLGITLFIRGMKTKYITTKVFLGGLLCFIFLDKGYLLYMNSFYGEPLILVSFMLFIGTTMVILNQEKPHVMWYVMGLFASGLFVGAKVANIPMGIFMMVFYGILYGKRKDKVIRTTIVIGCLCIGLVSVYFYTRVPSWMNHYNRYQSVFYGVLKDSPDPIGDLEDLGIDEKYAVLANSHAYMDHQGMDIHSPVFEEEVYAKGTPLRILRYYITHPRRLWEKMNLLASSSVVIRPPYVGNYLKGDATSHTFDRSFSLWEGLRKKVYSYSLPLILLISFCYVVTSVDIYRQKLWQKPAETLAFRVLIGLFAGSQFILPIIGNGEADLMKHMYLFNMIFDTLIVLLVMDIFTWIEEKQYLKGAAIIVLVGGLILGGQLYDKDTSFGSLAFGQYHGKPIIWEVALETEDTKMLISRDVIDYKPFDQESNRWGASSLRHWLNDDGEDGFLHDFTEKEKGRLIGHTYKSILSPLDKSLATEGHKALFWFPVPGYVKQNSQEAYGLTLHDRVFLLGVEDYDRLSFHRKKEGAYWLRTPYSNDNMARYVDTDRLVYHKSVTDSSIGIVPSIVIRK